MRSIIEARGFGVKYRRYIKKARMLKDVLIDRLRGTYYEDYWALRNIDFTLQQGESLGVIGPNGAGKSTLLKALAGVLPPSEGTLDVRGDIAPLLGIGGAFRGDLTGRENIFLHGAILGRSHRQIKERVDEIIAFSGLEDFIDNQLHTYSSGMRARLGFAVATDIDPEILLLDEILSVGDAGFRDKAQARMEQFFQRDKTIVIVSHSHEQILKLCTRVIYLHSGHLIADGNPSDIISQYMSDMQTKSASQ